MDYGALPPEVNSARMYSGAGSTPLLAAAGAWDAVASELRAAANGYASTIAGLSGSWVGPSSTAMSNAAASYTAWLTDTADTAEQFARHARTAATAYETAFAATVPPPVIAANRAQLAALTSTNIVGQNAAAIAHTEAQYAAMWSTDATAMYRYAAQSAAAANLSPTDSPPPTTNPSADTTQALSHTADTTNIQAVLSHLTSTTPQALHSLATPATATTVPSSSQGLLTALDDFFTSPLSPGNLLIIPSTPQFLGIDTLGVTLEGSSVGGPPGVPGSDNVEPISARFGGGGALGRLSVPRAWSAAAPAVTTVGEMARSTAAAVTPLSVEGAALPVPSSAISVAAQSLPAGGGAGQLVGAVGLSSLAARATADESGTARSMGLSSIAAAPVTANVYFVTPERGE